MRRFLPHAVFAALIAFAFAWSIPAMLLAPLPDGPNDFNSPGFIVQHSWIKFAMLATQPFRADLSEGEKVAKVARFFELNGLIATQERVASDPATTPAAADAARRLDAALRTERGALKNTVQRILEGRLTNVIDQAGLTRRFGADVVWPPPNIEFQDPPAVLVESPRSEIRKESETLLQGNLPIERVQRIESDAESDGETSALVVQIGGIAMYPAIIPPGEDYQFIMRDIAHEWMHHYLYFAPLGRRYFDNAKLTTLNETVANMVGRELGDMLLAEYPLSGRQPDFVSPVSYHPPGGASPAAAPGIDFTTEMRGLRRQVEALLAEGNIAQAERLMEDKRQFLAANGYYIRKLNQAYFAFHGSYADSAGSIDPIGPKLDQLRKDSGSLRDFVTRARALTSEDDLDRQLTESR